VQAGPERGLAHHGGMDPRKPACGRRTGPRYWASLVPTVFGVVMGLAGLAALPNHPGLLVKLLS
jgi:hypothetical protein